MKFTLGWLKEYLETDADLVTITDKLTALGLETEDVIDPARTLGDFLVVEILSASKHPDADRLQICQVTTGDKEHTIVCGAPNARAGMKGVLALPGAVLPASGERLRKGKIRGVTSEGMLCSTAELDLGEDHGGILELPEDSKIGGPAAAALGLDDPVIHLGLTPNRGDCLGVRGIARDLAAAGIGRLKPWQENPVAGEFKSPIGVAFAFSKDARDACPHFTGRYIKGVKNGPSPDWLARRLIAIGLRPVSALVDVTNLMTVGLGRPMHVFDADAVQGNLTIRLAQTGESLRALDDGDYKLDPEICVVADEKEVLSLAGIVGGVASGCTDDTTNVFLESAIFDPVRTAMTGRRLNVDTDSRHRFERGVDSAMVAPCLEMATRLILEICGGQASECVTAGVEASRNITVPFRPCRVASLGGVDVPEPQALNILKCLGFESQKKGDGFQIRVPSWRNDVHCEADLVEEVLRIHGYDAIPAIPLAVDPALPRTGAGAPARRRVQLVRRSLAARGMVEAVTWSFLARSEAEAFGGKDALALENPISAELDRLRPSILPNLILAAGRNADRGMADLALFEIGAQYAGLEAADQSLMASGLRAGQTGPRHWGQTPRNIDAFDAKADALTALAAAGVTVGSLETLCEAPSWYHPGRAGTLRLGPKNSLATFGEIHPAILEQLDVQGPIVGFEIFLDRVPTPKAAATSRRAALNASPFQAVERDFAFVVKESVAAGTVLRAVKKAAPEWIAEATVFDIYQGKGVAQGSKSLAISVRLQPRDKTLTDEEITAIADKIVASVKKATGAELRQ